MITWAFGWDIGFVNSIVVEQVFEIAFFAQVIEVFFRIEFVVEQVIPAGLYVVGRFVRRIH